MNIRLDAGRLILTLLILSTVSCNRSEPAVVAGVSIELAQHRARTISAIRYRLSFHIPQDVGEEVEGSVVISFELADAGTALQLDFREAGDKISSVRSNGTTSDFRFENEHIVIPASELVSGINEVIIRFTAGSASLNRNAEFLYTLFVPDRARTAFPLFDQPDLKATYTLTLDVPAGWSALSNAAVDAVRQAGNRSEYSFAESDLISSYLFSFVAGKFTTVTQERNGRTMTMLHREADHEKVQRSLDSIFDLHAAAIDWLETYTGIDYPYQTFAFALIPAFQYGGMEHVGAIQYRASSLFLDETPSDRELLGRASLIAHETAHMWFGNLVTMEWFNDVWTTEVFANFMAAKIVNPSFSELNHDLNFLIRHYPGAYSVDRTAGANPIRQELANLNEAGQMYGAIIYNKAPIMMRQLETLIGEDVFRQGLREYLRTYAWKNATWPNLIEILDALSQQNLKAWSDVWVNTAGRPEFKVEWEPIKGGEHSGYLLQIDASDGARVWPQQFEVAAYTDNKEKRQTISSSTVKTPMQGMSFGIGTRLLFSSDGFGYGLFPASIDNLKKWDRLDDVEKGSELINLFENLLVGSGPDVQAYLQVLLAIIPSEENQLILDLALGQLKTIYWRFLHDLARLQYAGELEPVLWQAMLDQTKSSRKKIYFDAFADIALSVPQVQKVYAAWSGSVDIDGLRLSENDHIELAQILAIKMPERATEIVARQISKSENPDNKRKFVFLSPSLSADDAVRDGFFDSLAEAGNRDIESWVLRALRNLHHPLRTGYSEQYLLASLKLLQEIQVTGDIFFPQRWLEVTFANYRSSTAVYTVRSFLEQRPDYNEQLRMKILQSTDMLFRANAINRVDGQE